MAVSFSYVYCLNITASFGNVAAFVSSKVPHYVMSPVRVYGNKDHGTKLTWQVVLKLYGPLSVKRVLFVHVPSDLRVLHWGTHL